MKKILVLMFIITTLAFAQIKVGIVFSIGGLGDMSFNDSAYAGLVKAKKDLGIEFNYIEPESPSEDEAYLKEFAKNKYDLVIGVGFLMKDSLEKVAKAYPKTKFLLLDESLELPNVTSIVFNEEEMGFLAGVLAGLMTKSNIIGFVGGMEIPLIQNFQMGYEAGAKYVNKNIKTNKLYTSGPNPFNDPIRGKGNAQYLINQGADILYHVAGGTGIGVIEAAKENKVFTIGVDSNQDSIAPGSILTCTMKNMDVAIFNEIKNLKEDEFKAGTRVYGIKENAISFTDLKHTKSIIGQEKLEKIEQIKSDIILNRIDVKLEIGSDEEKLFNAIKKNDLRFLKKVIETNKEQLSSYSNEYNKNPIDYAITNNKLDVVKLLIDNGIEFEPQESYQGYSSLELVIENNNIDILEYLISEGANLKFINMDGENFLDIAIRNNNFEMLKYFVSKEIYVDKDSLSSSLYYAIERNASLDIIKYLISKGASLKNENILDELNPIFVAVLNNNPKLLKFLIDEKLSINIFDKENLSPLDYAIENEAYECIKILLKNGIEINPLTQTFTSFIRAYTKNNKQIMDIFIGDFNEKLNNRILPKEQGIFIAAITNNKNYLKEILSDKDLINKSDYFGMTPVMWSTYSNNFDLVKLFVENGSNVNLRDGMDNDLLIWSCKNKNSVDVLDYLTKKGSNIYNKNKNGHSALEFCIFEDYIEGFLYLYPLYKDLNQEFLAKNASYNNSLKVLKYLVEEEGIYFNKENSLQLSVINNSYDTSKYLIEKGANVDFQDDKGNTSLLLSVKNDNLDISELLLANGANINTYDNENNSLLHIAVENENFDLIRLLIGYGININTKNNNKITPLYIAINNRNIEILSLLLENGADLNKKDENGWTPLMISIVYSNWATFSYLLDVDANIEEKTYDGESALMVASTNENLFALDKLISIGAEIDTTDNDGATPLMWAAYHNVLSSLEILLDSRANLEKTDYEGNTALIYAVKNNSLDAISYLIDKGANKQIKNLEGKGLLELAGKIETRKYLLAKGVRW